MNYLIFDLETNGVDVLNNSIMQMTIIAIDGKILLNEYVYPFDGKIDAVHVHKIDEKKLKESNALTLDQLCCLIKRVIRDNYGRSDITWVAYNNFGFDQIVLERGFKLVNNRMPDNWYFMDIMPLIKNTIFWVYMLMSFCIKLAEKVLILIKYIKDTKISW